MIKITIYQNFKKDCVGFRSVGHAGFSDEGQDIVCAAASMLIINTMNSIERFTDDETSAVSDDIEGYIDFRLNNKPSKEAALLLDSMTLGLTSMEDDKNYSKYIDLIFEEV